MRVVRVTGGPVRKISGVKRVTLVGQRAPVARFVADGRTGYAGDRLRYSVIAGDGLVQRGSLRVDLGPVKKERRRWKGVERRLRRLVRAEHHALGEYLMLHDRSRRKRRSGWIRDLRRNWMKAISRSL